MEIKFIGIKIFKKKNVLNAIHSVKDVQIANNVLLVDQEHIYLKIK